MLHPGVTRASIYEDRSVTVTLFSTARLRAGGGGGGGMAVRVRAGAADLDLDARLPEGSCDQLRDVSRHELPSPEREQATRDVRGRRAEGSE